MVDKVKEFVEEQLETIAQTKEYKILEARVMPDHIRLFVEADPFDSPTFQRCYRSPELQSCGVGYRAKAIKAVAKHIISGNLDLDNLIRIKYHDAKEELLKVYGIGNKIADCILLFSLEKLDAFPIDVWILRALSRYYSWLFNENENANEDMFKMTERITINQYKVLSAIMRNYFGKYSGYAQLFIFYYMRESAGKKW